MCACLMTFFVFYTSFLENHGKSRLCITITLYLNRSAAGHPSQEPEKTQKKSVQKEGSFAGPSVDRALPPKKRKASSEELSVPVRLIWLAYVLPFQSNSTRLSDVDSTLFSDNLLFKWKLNQVTEH